MNSTAVQIFLSYPLTVAAVLCVGIFLSTQASHPFKQHGRPVMWVWAEGERGTSVRGIEKCRQISVHQFAIHSWHYTCQVSGSGLVHIDVNFVTKCVCELLFVCIDVLENN